MYKDKHINESSESEISEDGEEYHNRITMLNNNRRQYMKQQSHQDLDDQNDYDQSSEEDQIYQTNFGQSNSNPKILLHHQQQININNQNENNDDDDDDDSLDQNIKEGQKRQGLHYTDSQQDSEQQQEEFNKYPLGNGIKTVREDSDEDSSDSEGMDHIEQRIKKLQKDLQNRLGKGTKQQVEVKPKNAGMIVGSKPHPPIPNNKLPVRNLSGQQVQNQNRMGVMNQSKPVIKIETKQPISSYLALGSKTQKSQVSIDAGQKSIDENKKKKKQKKQFNPESKTQIKEIQNLVKKQKGRKQPTQVRKQVSIPDKHSNQQGNGLNEKMDALIVQMSGMEKVIENLKVQNKNLKYQLEQSRDKQKENMMKNKKKPLEELQKLQELSKSNNSKLDKQIELLRVIEKLQSKLKKSISRKISYNQKGSATALHKGLPASFLANI